MSRFYNYYSIDGTLKSSAHKAAILSTVFLPLIILAILFTGILFAPISYLIAALLVAVYVFSAVMTVTTFTQRPEGESFKYSLPLLSSTLAGPVYGAVLLLVDPSLTGVSGFLLWGVIPIVVIVGVVIDEIQKFRVASHHIIEEELDDNFHNEDTMELDKIEA